MAAISYPVIDQTAKGAPLNIFRVFYPGYIIKPKAF